MNDLKPAQTEKWHQKMMVHLKFPDPNNVLENLKKIRMRLPNFFVIILSLALVWIISGIYIVAPDELGIVKSFGKLTRTTEPGPHYHLPYPIESVMKPKVGQIHRFEFGFRKIHTGASLQYKQVQNEALMLTGDENIIDLWFIVQLKIQNAEDYLFKLADTDKTIRDSAEATIRRIIGKHKIDEAMVTDRFNIQNDAQKALQEILDMYESGLQVITVQLLAVQPPDQVRDAFKEVVSAREEKNKIINEAEGYSSDLLPAAKGLAAQFVSEAQGYKEEKIKRAQGDAARFLSLLKEYRKAKDITRKRLYLETMEEIVGKARKLVIDSDKQGILPLLPPQELNLRGMEGIKEKKDLRR